MKKSNWLILLLLSLVSGCTAVDGTFTVASYNIRSFNTMSKKKDVAGTIRALGKLNSDICGLQEVRKNNNETTAPLIQTGEKLTMQPFFSPTLRRKNFEYGIGALSKFKAEMIAELKLPNADKQEPRKAMILKVHSPHGMFYFVNTHLAPVRKPKTDLREAQLKCILDYVEKNKLYPAILTGDLNAAPDSAAIKLLEQKWRIAGDNTPTYPASKPNWRIDFIAFAPADAFEVIAYEVGNEPTASDHRPIKAKLRINKPE